MHARHHGKEVHAKGIPCQVSPSRMLTILSGIPRDKPKVITGLKNDLKDIEEELIAALAATIQVNIRIYGNIIITETLPEILSGPDEYDTSAHNAFIAHAVVDHPVFLRSSGVKMMYDHFDFGDGLIIKLLQQAVQRVSQTPDEPRLIVKPSQSDTGEIIVTFAK